MVNSGAKRKAPAPPEGFQLWKRFTVFKAEEDLGVLLGELIGKD